MITKALRLLDRLERRMTDSPRPGISQRYMRFFFARWRGRLRLELERALTPVALTDQEREVVWASCHGFVGSSERWAAARISGLTDERLLGAIAYEYGAMGGGLGYVYTGGKSPRLEIGFRAPGKKVRTLKGAELLRTVRQVLDVPYPNEPTP